MRSAILFLFGMTLLSAQVKPIAVERKNTVSVFGGMGVNMISASDVVEYINSVSTFAQRVDDFGVAVDFFGGIEFPITDEWGVKLEHSYVFKSYTFDGNLGGTYDFFYATQSPSVIIQKIVTGKGYFVKFGVGGGYHFGTATQTISTFGTKTMYSASGIGIKAEVVGQTAFDENLYGYIGGSLGYEFMGDLKDSDNKKLTPPNSAKTVSLSYMLAGVRFGMSYYF